MERTESYASFGGTQEVWKHQSKSVHCELKFGIYLPPQAKSQKCPVVYWLSGLTCNEQNFITKANAQKYAAKHGVIVVAPDSSPRGEDVANDEKYDLGQGAGFYLNATQEPWAKHYQMYDYIVNELPALIEANFPATKERSIFGHSMGGHGALVIALKNPGRYKSVSAFSPIVAPSLVPWGQKAFNAYLGDDKNTWKAWDTCELIPGAKERLHLFVDQGEADQFMAEQLQPERLVDVCKANDHPVTLRMQPGYDHSYYFIASFIEDHFVFHAKALKG